MARPPLPTALAALREWPVARAWLDRHLARVGPAAFARDVEPLLVAAASGARAERDALVVLASWVAHGLDAGRGAELLAVGALADPGEAPQVRAAFSGEARRSLPPRGRLAEVDIATYADVSGAPHLWCQEGLANWRSWCAYVANVPPQQRSIMARRYGLDKLRAHHDPRFVARLLDRRWLSRRDVVEIAARRPTVPAIVLAVATRDRWLREAGVRAALVENPFTPAPLAGVLAAGTGRASRPRGANRAA
jgi:hypothetical protein